MKGLMLSLTRLFVSWAVVVAAILAWVRSTGNGRMADDIAAAMIAGSVGWLGGACLKVAIRSLRERAAIRRGTAANPPQDGPCVLVGNIDAARPLEGPLDGSPCVAYTYKVWYEVKMARGTSHLVLYEGVGLAPSQIVTPAGTFRLLAVPTIEGAAAGDEANESTRRRFQDYLDATPFRPAKEGVKELEARWSDADGSYRSDLSAVPAGSTPPVGLAACRFEQRSVPPGAAVCVFGHYSAEQRAVVAHGDWAKITRLLVGDPTQARRRLASRVILQSILGLVFVSAAVWILTSFKGTG